MTKKEVQKLKLVLEDGSVFEGESFGAYRETDGEVVFATAMVGYPESLTDPSYNGQILTFTSPLIGNYGVPKSTPKKDIEEFLESSRIWPRAIIVSEYSEAYSHWEADKSLGYWLKEHDVPGITGVDTRTLTKKIREHGVMLGKILFENTKANNKFVDPNEDDLISQTSIEKPKHFASGKKHVALIDTGIKNNIIRSFLKRNISITLVPWDHDFSKDKTKYDGYFFSNGPGDPTSVPETVEAMKHAFTTGKPTYGICMGSQIMAIAAGGKTYKMKYGHRSHNQPCTDLETGRCYITTQNHGFAVDAKSLPKDWKVWFENANDKTVEGIKHKSKPFASVQFHPEATSGPTDTEFIFDQFVRLL
ncbi:MAG: glutamine-hydrolyzing carbamoyl-phosphate synthase small subunit [Candidatus Peregrinibacteria bacterium]|nr:glutamine-hydrolyzing carbamoyl-phosphate synthase small subunit [Candidatus Peregrinibacteria bacterium]MDZ4245302.1 glutamine-hydrolyzing carbamoyl-phosphate synthase small subunit [Candidatus Gracilibacteria bacterium]